MFVWRKLLFVLAAMHVASGTWVKGTGIKYYLATCGKQNCDTVCGTFGFQCARTGQSFPPTSALWIFESLGISCKSFNVTDYYTFEDSPNYVAESSPGNDDWVGVCLGFKSIPSTIDCHTANNTYVRRLCPCYDPTVTQPPSTTSINLSITTQRTTTTTATTAASTITTTTAPPTTAGTTTAPTTTAATTTEATTTTTNRGTSLGTAKPPTTTTTTSEKTTSKTEATTGVGLVTTTAASTTDATTTTTNRGTSLGTAKPPTTTTKTSVKTTSKTEATTGLGLVTVEGNTTEKATGLPGEQAAPSGEGDRTALIVVAVVAAGLVVCLLILAFLLMWKRRKLRGKRNTKQDSQKLRVGYHKNNNKMAAPDMIDGLTVVADIEEENSYCDMKSTGRSFHNTKDTKVKSLAEDESSYENTFEQASENILYASIPEGTNMAFAADNNIPLYDRLA